MPMINESTWNPGDAPADVTPLVDAGFTVGLTIELTSITSDKFVVEGRTNNPNTTLPPAPTGAGGGGPGSTNTAPIASNVTAQVSAGVSATVGLNASDANTDPLTATLAAGPYTSASGNWSITVAGIVLTVQAPATALPNESVTFGYTVVDGRGGTASASVTITVGAIANAPPVANNASATVNERTTASVTVPISDPEGGAMTVALGTVDPSVTVTVSSVSGTSVVFTVIANGASANPTFQYTVSDGMASATGTVSLTVVKCVLGTPNPASVTVERRDGNGQGNADRKKTLNAEVTFNLPFTGPCAGRVTFEFDRNLSINDTPDPVTLTCTTSPCSHKFAKYDGDWIPPGGNVATTHTWTLTFKLDNSTAITKTVTMTIIGKA